MDEITYSRELVFAAACAAQRINGNYFKSSYNKKQNGFMANYRRRELANSAPEKKLPNVSLMKALLKSDQSDILPEDYEKGELIRNYFCSLITLVFSGDAKNYMKRVIEAATLDKFSTTTSSEISNDPMMPLVASLPSVYEKQTKRNQERDELNHICENSTPLPQNLGDGVKLNVTVVDSVFKQRFGSSAVNAIVNNIEGHHIVFFFDRNYSWIKGSNYNITGRIKNKRIQTTQLSYVRQLDLKKDNSQHNIFG